MKKKFQKFINVKPRKWMKFARSGVGNHHNDTNIQKPISLMQLKNSLDVHL